MQECSKMRISINYKFKKHEHKIKIEFLKYRKIRQLKNKIRNFKIHRQKNLFFNKLPKYFKLSLKSNITNK